MSNLSDLVILGVAALLGVLLLKSILKTAGCILKTLLLLGLLALAYTFLQAG